ncbi:MAG: phosphoenolpyruvate synthase [Parcubacteria group bacterium CG08_land_8_20_14_0_20_48_21]|nr:MAG: phosphoenolpyruvate synthase [Parcubacteria group bacterium CG2_30_48_51]PIS33108.1 MAG: phosphoenolpyruvate synthase [Parcubacteria group bacterium CG08_land_8_20_14_0_20_48_21]PIW79248.1 MAG: phosphoenolpyruvate synthase [Parcubacteria group bacterium CG_4_8_14_3_um_filter_48_16]PIY78312.1 MAG: phosphoenolpyruvate synthase [Parcubacteria group bacterium CG_4_10_14_0_8_um_filter_48_154]PIZ77691.1 MAG: phosphoenolpyruvate synthase [bacterium CG_4_10_14_0_2_um_filter_48_144]PJC39553.1 M
MQKNRKEKLVLPFNELGIKDVPLVGGKNASLGEMYRYVTGRGVRVPNGYAVTAYAYHYFLREAGIKRAIRDTLKDLDTHNIRNLQERGKKVRQIIMRAKFPQQLEEEIIAAYKQLSKSYGVAATDVAVRSSATAEDLPDASFAGQQETYLNITNPQGLLDACKKCMASLFTDRAISYREDKHFDHFKIGLSIGVQKMVRSDKAVSGVMFTLDTESGFRDVVLINASYGLGENIVKGVVTPDESMVFKPTLKKFATDKRINPIIVRILGTKEMRMVYGKGRGATTKNIPVPQKERNRFALKPGEVIQLAEWGVEIEKHYKRPMDIEWAKDGVDGKLYIVQARPETIHAQKHAQILEEYILEKRSAVLTRGSAVGSKIGSGKVRIIKDVSKLDTFQKGEVLVSEMTDPDWEPAMKIASGIVTNSGGRTCHAAIVSREMGIPCVVGTGNADAVLRNGQEVTVSCAEGDEGYVYAGVLPFTLRKTTLTNLPRPKKTKIMMNIGSPDLAFAASFIPNDGVGLAREELIITNAIKAHPLALLNYKKLPPKIKKEIDRVSPGYVNKEQFFKEKLSQGIAQIAAAFYPKDVILRLIDFRTNEFAGLIGGSTYEPEERNPMIGWRGASRYYDPVFRPAFEMELKAIYAARKDMGLNNLKLMVPFCRTIAEGEKVLTIMAEHGFVGRKFKKHLPKGTTVPRDAEEVDIYVMCEIPSNVVLAHKFAEIFDGFSIGSNDLTQLTLGVDRDSEIVSHVYDERNLAVKTLIATVIDTAHKHKTKIGICGQAPSDFPDFAEFLILAGIDSISLNPDTVIRTTERLAKMDA